MSTRFDNPTNRDEIFYGLFPPSLLALGSVRKQKPPVSLTRSRFWLYAGRVVYACDFNVR